MLRAYPWPGNVRELRNEVERAVALSTSLVLDEGSFSPRIAQRSVRSVALGGDHTLYQIEREHIARVTARAPTFEAAAGILGIDDSTLWRKRQRYARERREDLPEMSVGALSGAAGAAR